MECRTGMSPIAELQTIDIGRLYREDKEEDANLFQASRDAGIFYLDLRHQPFLDMKDLVEDVFALSKDLFSLSEEEKAKYDIDTLGFLKMNGYISHHIPHVV